MLFLHKSNVGNFWAAVFDLSIILLSIFVGFLGKPEKEIAESETHVKKIAEEIYNVVSEIPSRGIELEEIQKSSKIVQKTGNFNPDVLYELNHRIDMEKRFLENVSNRLQSTFHALDKLAPNFANSVKEERENSRKIMEEMDQGRK